MHTYNCYKFLGINIFSFPEPLFFTSGSQFTISCNYQSGMEFSYWEHPTVGIIAISQGRFALRNFFHSNSVEIRVSNAQENDAGNYKCTCCKYIIMHSVIFFWENDQHNLNLKLCIAQGAAMVKSPPLAATFQHHIQPISPNSNYTIREGGDLNLTCNAQYATSRQWTVLKINTLAVTNSSDGRIIITSDYQLQFQGILLRDQAVYTCVLRNEVSTKSISANVRVLLGE